MSAKNTAPDSNLSTSCCHAMLCWPKCGVTEKYLNTASAHFEVRCRTYMWYYSQPQAFTPFPDTTKKGSRERVDFGGGLPVPAEITALRIYAAHTCGKPAHLWETSFIQFSFAHVDASGTTPASHCHRKKKSDTKKC
jgi:hypothetical protein